MIPVTLRKPNHNTPFIEVLALLDTGAEKTSITKELADSLLLDKEGSWEFGTANGALKVDTTRIDICIPGDISFNNFEVGVLPMPGKGLILGMNIITQGNMSFTNTDKGLILKFELFNN